MTPTAETVLAELRERADPRNVEGMARYGINAEQALGVTVTELRRLGRRLGRDHALAEGLWASGVHEARILASMVAEAERVTRSAMDAWARGFDSWDLCDQVCNNLFVHTPYAWQKARQWTRRRGEFQRRAGFALMASLAVHDRGADDRAFLDLLPLIEAASDDDRNYVWKAVNWALRNIGKRNTRLRDAAVAAAERIVARDTPGARKVGRDALRELNDPKTVAGVEERSRAR